MDYNYGSPFFFFFCFPFSLIPLWSGQGNNPERNACLGPIIGGPCTLIDVNHQLVTEQNLLGNWVLLYFGYTSSPDVGPEQVQMMAKAIDYLGWDSSMSTICYVYFFFSYCDY